MFSKRKVTINDDGSKTISTKNKTKTKYKNGDVEIIDHKRKITTNFVLVNDDGTRQRDGK